MYALIRDVIATHPCLDNLASVADLSETQAWAVFMAFEHERIHLETSSVLFRELPVRLLTRPDAFPAPHGSALVSADSPASSPVAGTHYPVNELVPVPAGVVHLGKSANFGTFNWDNEAGSRTISVSAFEASKFPVTNGEYHAFVAAGGYATQRYWSEAGWRWRAFRNAKWPPFWVPDGPAGLHAYALRLVFEVVPMAWSLPVVVNLHEARAFAAWRAERDGVPANVDGPVASNIYRLLTEPEHHRLRDVAALDADGRVCVDEATLPSHGGKSNMGLQFGSECAVDALPAASPSGVHDAAGNVWQWCEDSFAALPGFKVHRYYEDFSTPCFDGEHSVIMGGSWVSTGDLASRFARFHFRPHFTQHSGFRLVRGAARPLTSCTDAPPPYAAGWVPPRSLGAAGGAKAGKASAVHGADAASKALLNAFASPSDALGPYIAPDTGLADCLRAGARAAGMLADVAFLAGVATSRALVIGSGAGDAVFELVRLGFAAVTGIEHSAALHAAAESLCSTGAAPFSRADGAGAAHVGLTARLPAGTLADACTFRQSDPGCLPPDLCAYNAALIFDCLDRIPSPRACLGRMGGPRGAVVPGGVLAVACAYGWSEEITPREAWLGPAAGGATCVPGIQAALGGEGAFKFVGEAQLPVVERAGARAMSIRVLHVTLWKRLG